MSYTVVARILYEYGSEENSRAGKLEKEEDTLWASPGER